MPLKRLAHCWRQSVERVTTIVNESKTKVDRLMNDSREKVELGSETARSCNEALEEILAQVSAVDTLVSEIAVASSEQSTGIREIAKAVGQMEQVTQQNSGVAEQSSAAAVQLKSQSGELRSVIERLANLVNGEGADLAVMGSHKAKTTARPSTAHRETKKKILNFTKRDEEKHAEEAAPVARVSGDDFAPDSNSAGFDE